MSALNPRKYVPDVILKNEVRSVTVLIITGKYQGPKLYQNMISLDGNKV